MKAYTRSCLLAVLIAVLILPACSTVPVAVAPAPDYSTATVKATMVGDGNVIALGLLDTCKYLVQVFQASPGTFIMESPTGQFLFSWTMGSNWGFLAVDANGVPVNDITNLAGSNMANTFTFTDLVKTLEANGWTYVFPSAIPAWLASTFGSVSAFVVKFGDYVSSPIPLFIILPGGVLPDPTGSVND